MTAVESIITIIITIVIVINPICKCPMLELCLRRRRYFTTAK
jgi:hypothetical protein